MIRWIKQHPKAALGIGDGIVVLLWVAMKIASDALLTHTSSECDWVRFFGIQCLTCGGTHFASEFLGFNWVAAFFHNELLFFTAMYLLVTWGVLHVLVFFKVHAAKKILKFMYNIPVLILYVVSALLFLVLRNADAFYRIFQIFYIGIAYIVREWLPHVFS